MCITFDQSRFDLDKFIIVKILKLDKKKAGVERTPAFDIF